MSVVSWRAHSQIVGRLSHQILHTEDIVGVEQLDPGALYLVNSKSPLSASKTPQGGGEFFDDTFLVFLRINFD